MNSKQVNEFMREIGRAALPSIGQAKDQQAQRRIGALEADRATVRDEIQWEQALERAAIEKEERERRFVEPEGETRGGATATKEQEPQHTDIPVLAIIRDMEQQQETQEPNITEVLKADLAETDRFIAAELLRLSEQDSERAEKRLQEARAIPGVSAALEQLLAEQRRHEDEESQRQLDDTTKFLAADLYEKWKKYPNRYRTHWGQYVSPGLAAALDDIIAAEAEREYARHDPAHDETAWQDAVARAAIAKEDREREFVEPRPAPAAPARDETRRGQPEKEQAQPAPNFKGAAALFRQALQQSDTPEAFILALDERKIMLACATREEAHRSRARASFARQFGNFAQEYAEGEIVAVTYQAHVYKLSERNTGMTREDMEAFLEPLDRRPLQSIEATKDIQNRERHDRNEFNWPTIPKQPERQVSATGLTMQDAPATSKALHFQDAASSATHDTPPPIMPAHLRGIAAEIWTAYNTRRVDREWQRENAEGTKETVRDRIPLRGGRDPYQFGRALDERGLILARTTKEEAEQSRKDADHWKGFGDSHHPVYREGEFVVIGRRGETWKLNERTTGHAAKEVQAFLNKAEWKALRGIEAGRQAMKARADQRLTETRDRAAHWDVIRLKNATRKHGGRGNGRVGETAAPNFAQASGRAIGSLFAALGKLADGFSLDALTPKEKYEAAKRDARNEREADTNADYAAYMAALAEQRRRDQQRQAEDRQRREPQRDR